MSIPNARSQPPAGRLDARVFDDGDMSQIEARVTVFLAGERRAIEVFRDYDRKIGPDIYKATAAAMYRIPHTDINDEQRQAGKVATLALGFGGGAIALLKMARVYGLKLEPMLENLVEMCSGEDYDKVLMAWAERGRRSGVRKAEWLAAEFIKVMWRTANPAVVAFWKAMEDGAKAALRQPGKVIKVGNHGIAFQKSGKFLRMRVPAGDFVYFPSARLIRSEDGDYVKEEIEAYASEQKRWRPYRLYGGLIFQNAVQRTARDIMVEAMFRVDDHPDFDLVLTIHDELLTDTLSTDDAFVCNMLSTEPAFLPGIPVASAGWRHPRFRKG